MRCRIASATAWLRGAPGPRVNTTGGPKRRVTLARQANGQRMCTASVPRMAMGTTGTPECSASKPTAPLALPSPGGPTSVPRPAVAAVRAKRRSKRGSKRS